VSLCAYSNRYDPKRFFTINHGSTKVFFVTLADTYAPATDSEFPNIFGRP